jgi:hypothetical protein
VLYSSSLHVFEMEASLKLTGKYFRIVPDNERPCGVSQGVDTPERSCGASQGVDAPGSSL